MSNNNQTEYEKMQEEVLEKIRTSEVRMRPKFYFSLKVTLLLLLVLAILCVSALLFSFIILTVRVTGHFFLLGFGERGFEAFFLLFPWKFLFVDLLLILALEWVLKRFRFGYRSPLAYLLAAIFLVTILIGALIDATHLHEGILRQADRGGVPGFAGAYEHVKRPPPEQGVVSGTVQSASTTFFTLESAGMFGTSTIVWKVFLPPGVTIEGLYPGDQVLVAGDLNDDTIRAYGIKKIGGFVGTTTTMK